MYAHSRASMSQQGGMSVEPMCQLAGVSRASFYCFLQTKAPRPEEMCVRDALHRAALDHRCYGSRRLTALMKREGSVVNRKRIQRLPREDNLLAVRQRRFVVTTDSAHDLVGYPNLARRMHLTGVYQLWVADLTYLRQQDRLFSFVVVLDAHSRRVIGWALDRFLHAALYASALARAGEPPNPAGGWCITRIGECCMPAASMSTYSVSTTSSPI